MAQGSGRAPHGENDELQRVIQQMEQIKLDHQKLISAFSKEKKLTIVVSGRTGVGKSTLIASLLPDVVTKAQCGPNSTLHDTLEKYEGKVTGGDKFLTVYDTRGFCSVDPADSSAKSLHKELKTVFGDESKQNIDLLIFCQEMYARFDEASLKALESFGSMLRKRGWECCVVALTKANVLPIAMKKLEPSERRDQIKKLTEDVKRAMQKQYFSKQGLLEVSEQIPFVPVGCIAEGADERGTPGSEDSIQDLINQCILRCESRSVGVFISAVTEGEGKRRALAYVLSTLGAAGAGASVGAFVGGLVGTMTLPGIGTASGVYAGSAIGGGGASVAYSVGKSVEALANKALKWWHQEDTEGKTKLR